MRIFISLFILLSVQFCFGYEGVQTNGEKKLVTYTVQPKDTWTNLSKKYHTTVKELQTANTAVTDLKIGQLINVPSSNSKEDKLVQTEKLRQFPESKNIDNDKRNPVYYSVKAHETLYHISKENKVSVDDLKKWNGLSSNIVSIDQRLIVGYNASGEKVVTPKEVPVKVTHATENPIPKTVEVPEVKPAIDKKEKEVKPDSVPAANKETTGANKVVETGVVSWFGDGDLNQNKFYALHRTAPIGTIIKVTNRMNNNSVFVKVVGALPTTGDNENIILKITQAAAQRVGALDQKFQAELNYAIAQ